MSGLPTVLIIVLYFNFKNIRIKLYLEARIVAYIQLFHEDISHKDKWIGWETSLKYYRMFKESHKCNYEEFDS
jgi:hypothetical protein